MHHPTAWSSAEAGTGFTESKRYAKLKDIPPYQEQALHLYDSTDYALNAFNIPIVGYGGENDPQLQASTNIVEALESTRLRDEDRGVDHARGGDRLPPRRGGEDGTQDRPRERRRFSMNSTTIMP